MKTRLTRLLPIALLCLGAESGCDAPTKQSVSSDRVALKNSDGWSIGTGHKINFEGHDYFLVTFGGEAGGAITHAESCSCRKPTKLEKQ